jgi:hypothetical protein
VTVTLDTSSKNRTIVRPKRWLAPRPIRAAFTALEHLAPALGARWAVRLWCTVPRGAARRQDNRPRPGAVSTVDLSGGRSVVVESWGSGPPVYLVHGWGGWRGQLGAFVDPLLARGYRVVAFDAPSHGESAPGSFGRAVVPSRSSPTRCGQWSHTTAHPRASSRTPSAVRPPPLPSRTGSACHASASSHRASSHSRPPGRWPRRSASRSGFAPR